ncbi:MAG TPA: hypothetical protein VK172_04485 [Lentimicrobium sp.]|nr:hypothetical protein [Lentimicrobium sp.]
MIRRLLIFALFLSFSGSLYAQYYDIGQEDNSIKWKQIRTKNFRLIFPDYYENSAVKTALLLEQWRLPVSNSLNLTPPLTPVIFHTGSVYSNAYTIWAPRRIEFLTTPPQEIYAQPWNEQLVIHEYRHIAQISKMNQGFTEFLGQLFGQQAAPAIIGLFIPSWFLEGDAVTTETALTKTGRGRIADFAMPLKAQLKEKGRYHYTKAVLGSYKDFVPDPYILGYHIVSTSRARYGSEIWNSAIDRTARKPYTLNPFSKGIKKISGLKKKGLYNQSMADLDSLWNLSRKLVNYSNLQILTQKSYTSYTNPFPLGDKMITLKKSLSDIHRIVAIDKEGSEKIIYTPGFFIDDQLSYNGKYISWIEERPHLRWQITGFSTIVMFNPETGDVHKIRTRQMLFAPTVSPDNKLIAVSEVSPSGSNYLTFIDMSGKIVVRHPSPENLFLSSPAWSPDGKEIVCVATGNEGKRIILFRFSQLSLVNPTFEYITGFTRTEISKPLHAGDKIIFNMDVNEVSEVCQINLSDGSIYQLTNSQFGTKHPYSDLNGNLYFSVYSSAGYRIAKCTPNQLLMQRVETDNINTWPLAEKISLQESLIQKLEVIPSSKTDSMAISDFSKPKNLFYFHSWGPAYIDINDQTVRPGISVMSQNLLSTLFVTAGYDYSPVENTGRWSADISYRGLYPLINASFSYGDRADWSGTGDTSYRYTWHETALDFGVSQWLSSFTGRYSYGMFFEIKHQLQNNQRTSHTPHYFMNGITGALGYRAYFNFYEKTSIRDLAPRTGFSIDVRYKNAIFGDYKAGDLFSSQFRVYLPGLSRNHSLQLYSALQKRAVSSDGYRFSGDISLPAGYDERIPGKMVRLRPSYALPLFYPDWHLGTAIYMKRVRTNLFYDYAIDLENTSKHYSAIGLDLITDFHLFALPAPVTGGIRTAYLPETGKVSISLIFNLDFTQY